ncbi:hypothetical protein C0J52_20031 [Blattella germanica]|nr:hypothetical protein C0J52_20031 [Blattella germanica]
MSDRPKLFYTTILVILVFFIVYSKGVKIKGVGLASGLPYVHSRFEAHFSYNLTLEQNEILQSVLWTKDGDPGIYEWTESGINRSGVFENASAVANKSGEFEFKEARVSQAGNYTVKLTTNMGNYSGSVSSFANNIYPKCLWGPSVSIANVIPYPNITCLFQGGIFGESYETLVKEIGIGSDFDVNKFKLSSVSGQPCYEPLNITIYTLEMIIGDNSRHGGYVPLTEFNYTCPNIHNPPNKTIKCGEGGQWLEKDANPWPNCNSSGTNSKISLPVLLSFIIILVRYNSQVSADI